MVTTVAHAGRAVKTGVKAVKAAARTVQAAKVTHAANTVNKAAEVSKGAGRGAKTTLDYLKDVQKINGNYYAPGKTLNEIGQIEARGVDFTNLSKKMTSSRSSTEGGFSRVYNYSALNLLFMR